MIELILQAERALTMGLLDQAEKLYRQAVDADPRNAIALLGLARVAQERGDDREAYVLARRAQTIDPQDLVAERLVPRLADILRYRGEAVPTDAEIAGGTARARASAADVRDAWTGAPTPAPPTRTPSSTPGVPPAATGASAPAATAAASPSSAPATARPAPSAPSDASPTTTPSSAPPPAPSTTPAPTPAPRTRGLLGRLLRRRHP